MKLLFHEFRENYLVYHYATQMTKHEDKTLRVGREVETWMQFLFRSQKLR
jgi:hypothetical protein